MRAQAFRERYTEVMSDRTTIDSRLTRPVPPRYIPLIERMKFYIEPEVSCSRFFGKACFTEKSVARYRESGDIAVLAPSEMGSFVAERLRGGLFLDIPCGMHAVREAGEDFDLVPIAEALGAADVWEVDATEDVVRDRIAETMDILGGGYRLGNRVRSVGLRTQGALRVATMQDDLLGFLAKYVHADTDPPLAVYVSGVQPDAGFAQKPEFQEEIAVPYLEALFDELQRVCRPGDMAILNSGDMLVSGLDEGTFPEIHPALALPKRGFTLERRDMYNKVQVFVKD